MHPRKFYVYLCVRRYLLVFQIELHLSDRASRKTPMRVSSLKHKPVDPTLTATTNPIPFARTTVPSALRSSGRGKGDASLSKSPPKGPSLASSRAAASFSQSLSSPTMPEPRTSPEQPEEYQESTSFTEKQSTDLSPTETRHPTRLSSSHERELSPDHKPPIAPKPRLSRQNLSTEHSEHQKLETDPPEPAPRLSRSPDFNESTHQHAQNTDHSELSTAVPSESQEMTLPDSPASKSPDRVECSTEPQDVPLQHVEPVTARPESPSPTEQAPVSPEPELAAASASDATDEPASCQELSTTPPPSSPKLEDLPQETAKPEPAPRKQVRRHTTYIF